MASYNHYARKTALTRALIEGTPATALCGEPVMPTHQGKHAVPGREIESRKLKTCPECALFYNAIPETIEAKIKEPV